MLLNNERSFWIESNFTRFFNFRLHLGLDSAAVWELNAFEIDSSVFAIEKFSSLISWRFSSAKFESAHDDGWDFRLEVETSKANNWRILKSCINLIHAFEIESRSVILDDEIYGK